MFKFIQNNDDETEFDNKWLDVNKGVFHMPYQKDNKNTYICIESDCEPALAIKIISKYEPAIEAFFILMITILSAIVCYLLNQVRKHKNNVNDLKKMP